MKKITFILILGLILAIKTSSANAATVCNAELDLIIKDSIGNTVNASFEIYTQTTDVNGQKKPNVKLATGKIDPFLGRGTVKFKVTETPTSYVIKVVNPVVKKRDYYYFDSVNASCGYKGQVSLVLSLFRVKVSDGQTNILKNISFSVWSQGTDAAGALAGVENLGSFNTGNLGYIDLLLPTRDRALSANDFYLLSIKSSNNKTFYEYTLLPRDSQTTYLDVRLSDLVVLVKDSTTNQAVPNFKLSVSARANSAFGGYSPAKSSDNLITDDQGRAYIALPAGYYYLSYKDSNSEPQNIMVEVLKNRRNDLPIFISNYSLAPCDYKSAINLVFRDYSSRILGSMSYKLYLQKLDPEGWPAPGLKKASGEVDVFGLAKTSFTTSPSEKYLLELCPQKTKDGCFWFPNISFSCSAKLTLEKTLPTTTLIFRDSAGKLLTGQKFKLFQRSKDVDGNVIADKNLELGVFTVPANGQVTLYLPSADLKTRQQSYLIVVEQKNKLKLQADFTVTEGRDTALEYIVEATRIRLKSASDAVEPSQSSGPGVAVNAKAKMRGKIYLQVESRGEAWYIYPENGLRYYLGNAQEAYELMRRLGQGITNNDLAKIEPIVDGVAGTDGDGDGLPDRLERSLGTNAQNADTDADNFDDYQELAGGFNPLGMGAMLYNKNFASKQAGKIMLQVESLGEAWYVNPTNLRRYYLGSGADAYQLMRQLGVGITNADLAKITIGTF